MTAPRRRVVVGSADELEIVAFERVGSRRTRRAGSRTSSATSCTTPTTSSPARPRSTASAGSTCAPSTRWWRSTSTARTVTVRRSSTASRRPRPFDQLVLATGATPVRPALPGIDAAGIYGVQTLDDGIALRAAVDDAAARARRGGRRRATSGSRWPRRWCGAASTCRSSRRRRSRCRRSTPTWARSSPTRCARSASTSTSRSGSRGSRSTTARCARCARRAVLPADLVVLGLGVRPTSTLAGAAGIMSATTGGIVVDDHQRTSADGVFAAGDCVETFHRVSRRPVAIALGTHANKQGRVAGINCTGGDVAFPGVLGTAVSKICEYEVARTGLTEREAADAGFDAVGGDRGVDDAGRATTRTRADHGEARGSERRRRAVGARRADRRRGGRGEAHRRRRDGGLDEDDGERADLVDLGYAPPFSPLWDPVLVARRACKVAPKRSGTFRSRRSVAARSWSPRRGRPRTSCARAPRS